jgi:hypothetical protein
MPLDTAGVLLRGEGAPSSDTSNSGQYQWRQKPGLPAECDVSNQPGWFLTQQKMKKGKFHARL